MANPDGLKNGQKGLLRKTLTNGTQMIIGGLVTNSQTFNREAIEVTNKSSEQYRTYLDGDEGTKSGEHSCSVLFSSDTAYRELRTDFLTGRISAYMVDFDGDIANFRFKVTSMSDSAENNAAVSTDVTFQSSDSFADFATVFNFVVTDAGGSNFVVTDNGGSNLTVRG